MIITQFPKSTYTSSQCSVDPCFRFLFLTEWDALPIHDRNLSPGLALVIYTIKIIINQVEKTDLKRLCMIPFTILKMKNYNGRDQWLPGALTAREGFNYKSVARGSFFGGDEQFCILTVAVT